jgi:ABC-type multidrug transport system fused ATPase/permease subunit
LIDGFNIIGVGLHTLRQKISIIPQNPFIFASTAAENIDPFGKRSEDELWEVLHEVQLDHFFTDLPDQL